METIYLKWNEMKWNESVFFRTWIQAASVNKKYIYYMSKVKREESSRTFEPVQPGGAALRGTRRVPAEKKKEKLFTWWKIKIKKNEKKKYVEETWKKKKQWVGHAVWWFIFRMERVETVENDEVIMEKSTCKMNHLRR